jgi:G3E family GTPase
VLNSLLAAPGARLGVIINDFGAINVDAALVTGQVDQAEAISGGCLCCMPDNTPLDEALERLARPQLRLDAIVIEASGAAEPLALANLIRFSGVEGIRTGGPWTVAGPRRHGSPPPRWCC